MYLYNIWLQGAEVPLTVVEKLIWANFSYKKNVITKAEKNFIVA